MSEVNELISVIIPTYKRSKTLKRAIDSVINQTYKNIEIIVVDDNSNYPECREYNRKLVSQYKQIVFIENKINLGGGLARNEGIRIAKGKYIAFLDDDDEFYPNKIMEQYKLYKKLNNSNIGMIYCYANMINIDNSSYISRVDLEGNVLTEHVKSCVAATSWWFCPKEKLLSVGGFEDISSRQDASLLLKMFLKGYEVYRVPEVLLKYYWHDSNGGISKTAYSSVEAEEKYRDIFLQNSDGLNDKIKRKILYLFSYRLAMLYILLGEKTQAKNEYIKMLKYEILSIKNFRTLFGILFNGAYRWISKRKNSKRGAINL